MKLSILSDVDFDIVWLHFMTYHLLVALFNYTVGSIYTVYGATELKEGGALANSDDMILWYDMNVINE